MNVFARFWFEKDNKSYIGVGRAELLTRIANTGSISKAAKEMNMSYKAAWDSVDIMNKLSPSHLCNQIMEARVVVAQSSLLLALKHSKHLMN